MHSVSFDTETTGLELYRGHRMFAFSTCLEDGKTSVLRQDREPINYWAGLRKLWADNKTVIVMHNAKFDTTACINAGIKFDWKRPIHDTMLMSKILKSQGNHGLKELCYELAGYPTDDEKAVERAIGGSRDYSRCPEYIMDQYQKADAERTMLLYKFFWPKIQANPALLRAYNLEIDLMWTTIRMEQRGMRASRVKIAKLDRFLGDEIKAIESRLPKGLNPDKANDLRKFLFVDLGLPVLRYTEKAKDPSTKKDVLQELFKDHPDRKELQDVLKWRSYTRGRTMIGQYAHFMDKNEILHPTINTLQARTGRESCEKPNLQNVAKEASPQNPFPVPARRVFCPRPGFVQFLLDYSGIEARLLINASQDKEFIRIMREGGDPHGIVAELFFDELWKKAQEENDKKTMKGYRFIGKGINFGIPYGAGKDKIARILQLYFSKDVIYKRYDIYKNRFPDYVGLNKRFSDIARKTGIIETTFGRPIMVDRKKPYTAVNYHIQGTAGEILKYAQNRVDALLQDITNDEWRLQLPIHDELIIEAPRSDLKYAQNVLREIRLKMIDFPEFHVPLDIECKITATDWAGAKEYKLEK